MDVQGPILVITVANLKGGTGKTTSAGYLAHVLAERGRSVLAVDADPQGSLSRWQVDAEWSLPVIQLATPRIHRDLAGIVGHRFDSVVIDTPPDRPDIIASAMRAATHAVIPMAPTWADVERLDAVATLLADVAALRPDGRPPVAAVLLTKAHPQAVATRTYRELISGQLPVLAARVGSIQRYAQAVGQPITRASATTYGDALTELTAMSHEEASQ